MREMVAQETGLPFGRYHFIMRDLEAMNKSLTYTVTILYGSMSSRIRINDWAVLQTPGPWQVKRMLKETLYEISM